MNVKETALQESLAWSLYLPTSRPLQAQGQTNEKGQQTQLKDAVDVERKERKRG